MALTTLWVCVCPTRINMLEQIIDKQKLRRMMDLSERMYLNKKQNDKSNEINALFFVCTRIKTFVIMWLQLKLFKNVCNYLHSTA